VSNVRGSAEQQPDSLTDFGNLVRLQHTGPAKSGPTIDSVSLKAAAFLDGGFIPGKGLGANAIGCVATKQVVATGLFSNPMTCGTAELPTKVGRIYQAFIYGWSVLTLVAGIILRGRQLVSTLFGCNLHRGCHVLKKKRN
jgi:hypothetical protein